MILPSGGCSDGWWKSNSQKGGFQIGTLFDPPLSWGSDPSAHSVGRSEVSCDRNRELKKCNDAQRPCFGRVAREARREGSFLTTPQSTALTAPLRYGGRSRDDASVVYRVPCSPDKGSSILYRKGALTHHLAAVLPLRFHFASLRSCTEVLREGENAANLRQKRS